MHYLIPLTFNSQKATYCFTLLIKGNKWYFQHIESIFIHLDKISSLPTSTFPDLPEEQKAWIREEFRASEQVRLFNFLSKEKGRDFAFNWFRDGAGYFLAAKVWVPFIPAPKAFILYVCWEQANLRGNSVTLEKLDDNEAILRIKSNYLELYRHAAHLKQQISFEDYRQIFEITWQDRANNSYFPLFLFCANIRMNQDLKLKGDKSCILSSVTKSGRASNTRRNETFFRNLEL